MSNARQTEILELAFDSSTERLNVAVETSALPSGAATAAKQDTLIAKDFATQTTLAVASTTLTSIKDTAGIKKITDALPAGDNNIGNVDIVTLPSGNLGQQAKAASLSVAPATDITDATYIGDIKFGEALPTGSAVIGQVSINQTTDGTTNKVQARNATHGDFQANVTLQLNDVDISATNAVPIKSDGGKTTASKTRPADATAYVAGDVIGADPATNWTFSNVLSNAAGMFIISSVTLEVDVAAVPAGMGGFRLHLYDSAPTAIIDNAAFDLASGDRAKYLGYITLDTPVDLGTTLWSQTNNVNFTGKLAAASTTLSGMLETLGGYTPSSATVKSITLFVLGV